MRTTRTILFSTLVACSLACGPVDPGEETPDAGEQPGDYACEYPTDLWGSTVGKNMEPFELPDCDGNPYHFVNDDFCDGVKATVISIAAEWCPPCQQESSMMTAHLTEPYRERGVRVIQVITQNKSYGAPDQKLCREWKSRYNLTNIELLDPTAIIAPNFPNDSLPSTLVVDSKGRIRLREDGFDPSTPFVNIKAKLEEILAE